MENEKYTIEEYKKEYPIGSEAPFHGEMVIISDYMGDDAIVVYISTGEKVEISIEELIDQAS